MLTDIRDFLIENPKTVVLVSGLKKYEVPLVARFLSEISQPFYIEATAQMEIPAGTERRAIQSEALLSWALKQKHISSVLRLGSVPTARIWRDVDLERLPVLSIHSLPFPGVAHGTQLDSLELLESFRLAPSFTISPDLVGKKFESEHILKRLLEKYPKGEPSLLRTLATQIPGDDFVYLGNSLPIREWDLVAPRTCREVSANRGVNGIDGQMSTFYGEARTERTNWAIIGDLTAMYDMTAPWSLKAREAIGSTRVVIVNNSGGRIFERVTKSPLFINAHQFEFSKWAEMWKLQYQNWFEIPKTMHLAKHAVIEITPDATQTTGFWSEWDGFFRSAK